MNDNLRGFRCSALKTRKARRPGEIPHYSISAKEATRTKVNKKTKHTLIANGAT